MSAKQSEILAKRQNRGTLLSKPAFGISFEYPKQFSLKFDEEVKDVLMLQFLMEADEAKGEFTIIAGPDESSSDIERAAASLELITNMVGPDLFKHVTKSWIEKNLAPVSFGQEEGKKMILRSQFINFGIYFIKSGKLKYHFFVSTQGNIDVLDKIILEMFQTVEFTEPVLVLTPLIGETFKDYYDENFNFKISYPETYDVVSSFPKEEVVGENVTVNNSTCAVEFNSIKKEFGISIRVVIEKTKIKFADYVELFKLQLTKSRVLLAAVKESKVKLNNSTAVEFQYNVDVVSHIKRVGIIDGQAVILSVEHFGATALKPEKLFDTVMKSFRLFPRGMNIPRSLNSFNRYEHFDKNFSINFPEFCQTLYSTSNVLVISVSKKQEEYNGCFIQVLDFSQEANPPTIEAINEELLEAFEKTCTILYKKEVHDVEFGVNCRMTEFLIDGTWFVNPVLNHPHLNSMAVIRVISSPRYTFLFCFINTKENFNKSWEQFGGLMLNSVRFSS